MRAAIKKLFDYCPKPVLVTDTKARIVYVNPAWEKLTQYTLRQVKGKNPRLLQSGKTPPQVYRHMWRALTNKQGFQTEEVIDRRKDGREYSIHSIFYPLISKGKVRFYMQIQHDITRRKIADRQKRALLSLVSHELKTPLTAAKWLMESYRLQSKPDKHILGRVYNELQRMNRLINDILDLGRLETNKLKLRLKPVALKPLINDVIQELKTMSRTHPLTTKGPSSVKAVIDSDRIRQVLLNLLSNAIKYSAPQKPIRVSLKQHPQQVVVCVQDYGQGIPKSEQGRIFDRFYQIQTHRGEGFGLGLYISKQIIRRHRGKIWVESSPGRGSKFFFSLPVAPPPRSTFY